MNRLVFLVCVLVAAIAGFLVGRTSGSPGRSDNRPDYSNARTERRVVNIPADEVDVLRRRARRVDELEQANARLRGEIKRLDPAQPDEEDLPIGTRRPDGTIVGGAAWSPMTRAMAVGFLDTMMAEFFEAAHLTEDQKQRLKAEMEKRIAQGMQAAAEFVNGDATGDSVYEELQTMVAESRKLVDTVLDDEQRKIYGKFENGIVGFIHGNVVNNEMATLRNRLKLDPEQAKNVRAIVEARYKRVQEKFQAPIPNMFFRPVRREADAEIYRETGEEIRKYLRPDQAGTFEAYEGSANTALNEYRSLLVPKTR